MREFYIARAQFVKADILVFDGPTFVTGQCYIHEDYRPGCLGDVWTREDARRIFDAEPIAPENLPPAFRDRYPEFL